MKSNGLYCLVARPKVGKSLLALQLANSIVNGTTFLGFNTNPSLVIYISTEMNSTQLLDRINKMNLHLNDNNFFVEEQVINQIKLNLMDLKVSFKDFSENKKGKFVIIDMFCGIDIYTDSDLSNYQDMGQKLILERNNNLIFEVSEFEANDLNPNLLIFLNYAIRHKEFTFTCSNITGELNLL